MYRPDGWRNPYTPRMVTKSRDDEYWNDMNRVYEAGANAILKSIIELVKQKAPYSKLLKILEG